MVPAPCVPSQSFRSPFAPTTLRAPGPRAPAPQTGLPGPAWHRGATPHTPRDGSPGIAALPHRGNDLPQRPVFEGRISTWGAGHVVVKRRLQPSRSPRWTAQGRTPPRRCDNVGSNPTTPSARHCCAAEAALLDALTPPKGRRFADQARGSSASQSGRGTVPRPPRPSVPLAVCSRRDRSRCSAAPPRVGSGVGRFRGRCSARPRSAPSCCRWASWAGGRGDAGTREQAAAARHGHRNQWAKEPRAEEPERTGEATRTGEAKAAKSSGADTELTTILEVSFTVRATTARAAR